MPSCRDSDAHWPPTRLQDPRAGTRNADRRCYVALWNWLLREQVGRGTRLAERHSTTWRAYHRDASRAGLWRQDWLLERARVVPVPRQVRALPEMLAKARWSKQYPLYDVSSPSDSTVVVVQKVAWVPAYEAAQAFVEMRLSREPIVHLVHPYPVSWSTLLAPLAQELDVPLVPYTEWLSALEGSVERGSAEEVEAMRLNPALRLLSFYEAQGGATDGAPEKEAMGLVFIATDKAVRVSEYLARLPQLDGERARTWLEAWRKSGFLS